jgi:hypothetical protein
MNDNRTIARRGMTLVELMVIISATSVVLTTSAALMHGVMHTQKATRAFFDAERSAVRLSNQFRSDVHEATDATIDAGATGEEAFVSLQLSGNTTTRYRYVDGKVLRVQTRDGGGIAREEFVFPPSAVLKIELVDTPRRLVLSLTTPSVLSSNQGELSRDPREVPVYFHVEARLNRDAMIPITFEYAKPPATADLRQAAIEVD